MLRSTMGELLRLPLLDHNSLIVSQLLVFDLKYHQAA